ncbi:MAG: DUF4399 domain-containing protein [Myxococcota bacterium]
MTNHSLSFALLLALLGAFGCNEPEETATTPPEPEPAAEPAAEAPEEEAEASALTRSPAPEGARVFFASPADGATVTSPVALSFGIEGMDVAPAGTPHEHGGHHHLVIDSELPATDAPIPADQPERYKHFGDGSTETSLELAPGEHTLQLILGDHSHIPHDPPVTSEAITITVSEGEAGEGAQAPEGEEAAE